MAIQKSKNFLHNHQRNISQVLSLRCFYQITPAPLVQQDCWCHFRKKLLFVFLLEAGCEAIFD